MRESRSRCRLLNASLSFKICDLKWPMSNLQKHSGEHGMNEQPHKHAQRRDDLLLTMLPCLRCPWQHLNFSKSEF